MKSIKKSLYPLIMSAILLLVWGYCVKSEEIKYLPHFLVQSTNAMEPEKISLFDAENGNFYVFLPSYADMNQVTLVLPEDHQMLLDDILLSDGATCGDFALETAYDFTYGSDTGTIWFYRSANVGTVFIDTVTGSMDRIHKNNSYKESAVVSLYTADGYVNCVDENATLKGRGNSTWGLDKKPYALSLSIDTSLLGMPAATNWVLLANAYDGTNLHNKLATDIADQVGMGWVPECEYADVYLNGDYNGLYLLSEKVEVGSNRLNIDVGAGDFLCKVELPFRWDKMRNPFTSRNGRAIEITAPGDFLNITSAEVSASVNQMELALLSEADLTRKSNIDLDSWVRRYLIDEITGNIDSDTASSYFYCSDGVFFAGPIWDYDMTFGSNFNTQNPNQFVAKPPYFSDEYGVKYYSALCKNESFQNRVSELYQTEFLPVVELLIQSGIQDLSSHIASASTANGIRWKSMYDNLKSWDYAASQTPTELIEFLKARIEFLNSVWLEHKEYCTLRFDVNQDSTYWTTAVEKGSILKTEHIDLEETKWLIKESQSVFNPNLPVTEDMTLIPLVEERNMSFGELLPLREMITIGSIFVLLFLFGMMLYIDGCRKLKRRAK